MSALQQSLYYLKHRMISLRLMYMGREGECSENNSNRHCDQSSLHFSSVGCFNHNLLGDLHWAEVLSCSRKRLMLKLRMMWKLAFGFFLLLKILVSNRGRVLTEKLLAVPFYFSLFWGVPIMISFLVCHFAHSPFPSPPFFNAQIFLEITFPRGSCSQQLT